LIRIYGRWQNVNNYYVFEYDPTGVNQFPVTLSAVVGGVRNDLAYYPDISVTTGVVFVFDKTFISAYVYWNGVWIRIIAVHDGSFSSGSAGFGNGGFNDGAQFSNFFVADANAHRKRVDQHTDHFTGAGNTRPSARAGRAKHACRGDQRACDASSLLGEVHVGYAVFRAGHVRSAALEVHHDERRLAHDQGPLGIFLLNHTNLVVLKAGRLPGRETIRRETGGDSYAQRQVRLCRLDTLAAPTRTMVRCYG